MLYNQNNIIIVASHTYKARLAAAAIEERYGIKILSHHNHELLNQAKLIIVIGGDGFMLHSLHNYMSYSIPFYGINRGKVGFLLNDASANDLIEKIHVAISTELHPLEMIATNNKKETRCLMAINEVALLRSTNQTAHIKVTIDNKIRLARLVADGVLVATAAGSTAYNFSLKGPIIPLGSDLLAMTPISPFRPRHQRPALLPASSVIKFDILNSATRKVSVSADFHQMNDIVTVQIREMRERAIRLMFDSKHSLEERIIAEQFSR